MGQPPSNNNEDNPNRPEDSKPHPTVHPEEKNDTITNYCKYNGYHKHKISWPSKLTALCTLAIVFITFAYTYYAKEQVTQMKEAVSIASDTASRQLRAYISIDHSAIYNVANPLASEKPRGYKPTGAEITNPTIGPMVVVQCRNSGQTPAYNVKIWGIIDIGKYPQPFTAIPVDSRPLEPGSETNIFSQGTTLFSVHLKKPLTTSQIMRLREGKMAIYFYGEITYVDIFGKSHKTTFMAIHGPENKPIGISISMAICAEGNKAD